MSHSTGASCAELAQTGTIVGSQFCASEPIDLAFTTKAPWLEDKHITVTDIHGKFILWSAEWRLGTKRILYDTHNNPLISIRQKKMNVYSRWQVFLGDSSDDRNLLFNVKKISMSRFYVFLASNTEEKVCDFRIEGSYGKRTCTVYNGDSQMALAQMSDEHKAMNLPQEDHIFGVHINPNTDYCFIAALIVILHEIYDNKDVKEGNDDIDIGNVIEFAGKITEIIASFSS